MPYSISFSLWDFPGQDAYHIPHQLFVTPGAVYLVVFDMTVGMADAVRAGAEISPKTFIDYPPMQSLKYALPILRLAAAV